MENIFNCYGKSVFFLFIVILTLYKGLAEEECQGKSAIDCYDCDSRQDPRCKDPFNFTLPQGYLPQVSACYGCCVKVVRMKGTDYEWIWRTCTQKIKINLFMVDHVCMYESNRIGHMCFCEEDKCNQATPRRTASYFMVLTSICISLFHSMTHKKPFS